MKQLTKKIVAVFLFALFASLIMFSTSNAQDAKFRDQAWRYGLNAGLQFNSVSLGWQNLQKPYPAFSSGEGIKDNSDGKGYGAYVGIFTEYLSDSWWGVQLRASYDERNAHIKDTTTIYVPNEPGGATRTKGATYESYMNYLSFELLFRADQKLIPNLNIFFGPIVAANIHGSYDYTNKETGVAVKGIKLDNRNIVSYGISGGLAYDIEISRGQNSSIYLSPFAEASWIVNQKKTDYYHLQNSVTDVWSTLSYRFGLRLSFEHRKQADKKITEYIYIETAPKKTVVVSEGKKVYVVLPYENIILTKNVTGYFPILPYVFFDKGSSEIHPRYTLLTNDRARNFSETELQNFKTGQMTEKQTNIDQLMISYYNVMNIYGDRMRKNPNVKLTLRGCDPELKDGEIYANKVKSYLVTNFDINPDRISIIVEPPKKISGSALTDPSFAGLIDDENRRVVFVFTNQDMYKPLPYTIVDESSIDNDMIFTIGDNVQYKSWKVSITGENKSMNFGPFLFNRARINPAPLMRGLNDGRFNAKVDITMLDGRQFSEDLNFKLHKERELKNASRYLMIFDYNKSDAVMTYESKIRNEITPGMNNGNTVIIHGHTDIIGNEEGNQKLSQERADEAKRIVDNELSKSSKNIDVEAIGVGQTQMQYSFDNDHPEGRMYNRNVFIEVIPTNIGSK